MIRCVWGISLPPPFEYVFKNSKKDSEKIRRCPQVPHTQNGLEPPQKFRKPKFDQSKKSTVNGQRSTVKKVNGQRSTVNGQRSTVKVKVKVKVRKSKFAPIDLGGAMDSIFASVMHLHHWLTAFTFPTFARLEPATSAPMADAMDHSVTRSGCN
jgi:hypothetical protein